MSNNMPDTRSRQQRYHEKKPKEKSKKYLNNAMKKIKKGCKKWIEVNTEDYLRKKKLKKIEYVKSRYRNMSEEDKQKVEEYGKNTDKMCLKKTNKKEKNTWNNIWENTKKLIQQIIEENKGKEWLEKCWSRYGKQFHQKWL